MRSAPKAICNIFKITRLKIYDASIAAITTVSNAIAMPQSGRTNRRSSPKAIVRRLGYHILSFIVYLKTLWQRFRAQCTRSVTAITNKVPLIHRLVTRQPTRGASGSQPVEPRVLGVVLTEEFAGKSHFHAIARLLTWANFHQFRQIFLYDPSGILQERFDELKQQIQWVDPLSKMAVWQGWQIPPDSFSSLIAQGGTKMGISVLSSTESEAPIQQSIRSHIISASSSPTSSPEEAADTSLLLDTNNDKSSDSVLAEATSAPSTLRNRMTGGARDSLAGIEPDIVLVFGRVLTLAGYPPWAVRVSEIYHIGALASVTHSKLDGVLRRYMSTKQRFGR